MRGRFAGGRSSHRIALILAKAFFIVIPAKAGIQAVNNKAALRAAFQESRAMGQPPKVVLPQATQNRMSVSATCNEVFVIAHIARDTIQTLDPRFRGDDDWVPAEASPRMG